MNAVEFRTYSTVEDADKAVEQMLAQGIPADRISVVRLEGELAAPGEAPTVRSGLDPAQSDYPRREDAVTPNLTSRPPNLVDDPMLNTAYATDKAATKVDPVAPTPTAVARAEANPVRQAGESAPASPEEPNTSAKPLIQKVGAGLGLGALAAGVTLAVPGIGLVLGSGILAAAVGTMVKKADDEEDRESQAERLFLEAGAAESQARLLAHKWISGETVIRIEQPNSATATP